MSKPDIYWVGESGRNYGYWIHPIDSQFRKIAGNVIFAKQTENGEWVPLYIGKVRNFDEELSHHEMEVCAKKNGATHVHAHFSSPEAYVRKAEVADLIAQWQPMQQ